MIKLLAFKKAYLENRDGATAIEYGLIAAGISLAIATIVFTFGDSLIQTFTSMNTEMTDANARIGG
ncbi:MAG TPA: Flp family type IVb pilin [Alphaproteobacteria bacterium]|nr:Flp family type IVb pilin [Alphaproteobacteria bacterium]